MGHLTYDGYGPPSAIPINWLKDMWNGPIVQVEEVSDSVCAGLMDYFRKQKDARRTRQVLLMYGQDFAHRDGKSLDNLDKIINALYAYTDRNGMSDSWNFSFSTPENYIGEMYHEARHRNITFDVEKNDFWQYNLHSVEGAYWTGYFTTYPEIKRDIYEFGDFVQSATQIINMGTDSMN